MNTTLSKPRYPTPSVASALAVIVVLLACPARGADVESVVALGKLRPQGGITRVAAPFSLQGPSLLASLKVKVGQKVAQGEILAQTHVHAAAAAAAAQADAEIAVRVAKLAIVESGLKPAEVAALAAEAERERADLSEAVLLLTRAQRLRTENSISAQELENALTRWHSASNRVLAASQRLAAGAEVRAVDVALARAEVSAARALAERTRREMEQTEIRAPFDGEVLAIHARPGEVTTSGLLDLGRTDAMEVLAEVYESDIRKITANQAAEISGDAFPEQLRARVIEIGRQVKPNRLLNPDPAAFADNRIVEVVLEIADSKPVAGLSGALVNVRFAP